MSAELKCCLCQTTEEVERWNIKIKDFNKEMLRTLRTCFRNYCEPCYEIAAKEWQRTGMWPDKPKLKEPKP